MIWNRAQNAQAVRGKAANMVPKISPKMPAVKLGKDAPAPGAPGYGLAYIEMVWKMEMDGAIAKLYIAGSRWKEGDSAAFIGFVSGQLPWESP